MSCEHKRLGSTAVILHQPGEMPRLVIRAQCMDCQVPFEFVGLPSDANDFFHLSADKRELRIAISEPVARQ